jgi:rSAM/selenodomain-associated transferase 1
MSERATRGRDAARLEATADPWTLAIVAKYPSPGAVKTRLAATLGAAESAGLYRAFLRDLATRFSSAARRDGYTLVWAHAPGPRDLREVVGATGRLLVQRGDDFAERLYHVCADLGAAGYRRVVVVSSDSPHLPAAWVRRAFAVLDQRDVALGPAEDGGYYLVAVQAAPAPPDLFRGIRMSTPHVLAETLRRADDLRLGVELLPATFDVDEAADLIRLARALERPGPLAAPSPHTHAALRRLGVRGAETQSAVRDAS